MLVTHSWCYLPAKPNDLCLLQHINACLKNINTWMANNFLELNENKLELLPLSHPNIHIFYEIIQEYWSIMLGEES